MPDPGPDQCRLLQRRFRVALWDGERVQAARSVFAVAATAIPDDRVRGGDEWPVGSLVFHRPRCSSPRWAFRRYAPAKSDPVHRRPKK